MKKVRCYDMLRDDIKEFMSILGFETLNDMVSRAQEREIDLEHLGKRVSNQVPIVGGPGKRPKSSDQGLRGQQCRGQRSVCGKMHNGGCHSRGLG